MRTTTSRHTLLLGMVLLATGLMVACSGGGNGGTALAPTNPGAASNPGGTSSAQTAKATLAISIPNNGQLVASDRRATKSMFTSGSIVVRYVADSNPANAPSDSFDFPATSPIAAGTPVNVSSGAGGNCATQSGVLNCTVPVTMPTGVLDVYLLVFDSPNGTGALMYGSVTTLRFNANGTFSAATTSGPSSLNTLQANPLCGVPTPTPAPSPTSTSSAGLTIQQYSSASSIPVWLVLGPDGNIWFSGYENSNTNGCCTPKAQFGSINVDNGTVSASTAPYADSGILGPIIDGPSGTLWYESCGNDPHASGIEVQIIPPASTTTYSSSFCPKYLASDGTSVWVTGANEADQLLLEDVIPGTPIYLFSNWPAANGMTFGPDGALWLTGIVRITTSGNFTQITHDSNSYFISIVSQAGYLWAIDSGRNLIARISTNGAETDYSIPSTLGTDGGHLATSSGKYLYFSDVDNDNIDRLDMSTGEIQEFGLKKYGFQILDIAVDSSGNVWADNIPTGSDPYFTGQFGTTILKVTLPP